MKEQILRSTKSKKVLNAQKLLDDTITADPGILLLICQLLPLVCNPSNTPHSSRRRTVHRPRQK